MNSTLDPADIDWPSARLVVVEKSLSLQSTSTNIVEPLAVSVNEAVAAPLEHVFISAFECDIEPPQPPLTLTDISVVPDEGVLSE